MTDECENTNSKIYEAEQKIKDNIEKYEKKQDKIDKFCSYSFMLSVGMMLGSMGYSMYDSKTTANKRPEIKKVHEFYVGTIQNLEEAKRKILNSKLEFSVNQNYLNMENAVESKKKAVSNLENTIFALNSEKNRIENEDKEYKKYNEELVSYSKRQGYTSMCILVSAFSAIASIITHKIGKVYLNRRRKKEELKIREEWQVPKKLTGGFV